jgi:hypothetical protein
MTSTIAAVSVVLPPRDLVEPALVGTGPAPRAFCDVEHDAQARALQLIPERAVIPAREQAACRSMQPKREMVDLETLMFQLRPARLRPGILGH